VVLEFWATWCGPCVENIPHMNQLAASVDPARVQFISIDYKEDPKTVQNFLAQRKMAGWIGMDATGGVFKSYGGDGLPTTVIVDKHGRIIGITAPEELTVKDLLAVTAGKQVAFKSAANTPLPAADLNALKNTIKTLSGTDALFEVSLTKAAPNVMFTLSRYSGDKLVYTGATAHFLMHYAFNLPDDRFILNTPLPPDTYNLLVISGGVEASALTPVLQTAIPSGLHLRVARKIVTGKAYVLRATARNRDLLLPAASKAEKYNYWKGEVHLMGGSMDILAFALETALRQPVLNETGIAGTYDALLAVPTGDVEAAKAAVAKMGLQLVEEQRPVPMLEVSAMPGTPSDVPKKPSEPHK
jgi:hypothetical protein